MSKKRKRNQEIKTLIAQQFEYSNKVKEYLESINKHFLADFAELCQQTNGRVSFVQIQNILGKKYPIAEWIDKDNMKEQIIIFFQQLDIPFKATENHLYFP